VVWGAGAKAVGLLNTLHIAIDDGIRYVVNPRKSRRFVLGPAQQIVPPEHLRDYRPDVVIVMNAEYIREI